MGPNDAPVASFGPLVSFFNISLYFYNTNLCFILLIACKLQNGRQGGQRRDGRAAGTVSDGYDDERDSRRGCVSSLGPRDDDVSWAIWKVPMTKTGPNDASGVVWA